MLLRGKVGCGVEEGILSSQVQGPASQLGLLVLLLFSRVVQKWVKLQDEGAKRTLLDTKLGRTVPCRAAWIEKERRFSFSSARTYLPTYFVPKRSTYLIYYLLWHQIRIVGDGGSIRRLEIEIVCVRACVFIDTSD